MKIKNRINRFIRHERTDGRTVMAGVLTVFFSGVLSRVLSGSPLYMLRLCGLSEEIPRAWVFTLIWSVWYILLGFSLGFVLGTKKPGCEVEKYKGSLWFVLSLIFNLLWYPMFFRAGTVFLALIDIMIIAFFCILCAIEYFKAVKPIGILMFLYFAWLIFCFFLNLKAFLNI